MILSHISHICKSKYFTTNSLHISTNTGKKPKRTPKKFIYVTNSYTTLSHFLSFIHMYKYGVEFFLPHTQRINEDDNTMKLHEKYAQCAQMNHECIVSKISNMRRYSKTCSFEERLQVKECSQKISKLQ